MLRAERDQHGTKGYCLYNMNVPPNGVHNPGTLRAQEGDFADYAIEDPSGAEQYGGTSLVSVQNTVAAAFANELNACSEQLILRGANIKLLIGGVKLN